MNLVKTLRTQLEKGNNFVDYDGNLVSMGKIEKKLKKEYSKVISSGEINPLEITFDSFLTISISTDYLPVEAVIDFILGTEDTTTCEDYGNKEPEPEPEEGDFREMPEPFEPDAEEIPE